jgi:hypothetical protein
VGKQLSRLANRWWWVILAAILLVYAGLGLYQIDLPGLHYDEAFEAVPAVQLLRGLPVTAFRESGITLGGQIFPLMTQDYIGAINLYGAIPFIAMLGPTPAALRLMSILFGALTIVFAFGLAHRLTGNRWVGLVTGLLLAVSPTFIFWNRQGVFVTSVTATLGVAAAYCWTRRWHGGSIGWSVAGAFLFGLGLYAKFLFLWLIFALFGAVLLLNLPWLVRNRGRLVSLAKPLLFPEAIAVGLAFLLGCWPLLVYNLQTGGTLLSISGNAATSYYGVNNLAFGSNLIERGQQFFTLLNSGHLWYLGQVITNPSAPVLFVAMILAIVVFATRRQLTPKRVDNDQFSPTKIVFFPLLVIALIIVASIGTVSALWITHFAILMPWPALAIAIGTWYLIQNRVDLPPSLRRAVTGAVWGGLALLAALNLLVVVNYHRALSVSGGLSAHSDAVYDLSRWLDDNARGVVVAMDWGLAAPVVYLTNGRVNAVEVFGYQWQTDAELTERLQGFIGQPEALYLWRAPEEIIFDRSNQFQSLYRPQNLEENIEDAFYERSGRPILGVTRLVEKGTAANPPQ